MASKWHIKMLAIILICLGSCLPGLALAEFASRIHFQNILDNKDIALGEVGAIYQDKEGFMWFGGGSFLVQYDGYAFREIPKLITDEKGETVKLPLKFATKIFEDTHGDIWVTARTGIYRYDPALDGLVGFTDSETDPIKLSTHHVYDALQYSEDEIIVATPNGVVSIDLQTETYVSYSPDPAKKNWIQGVWAYSLHMDKNKTLYIGTRKGLEVVDWENKHFSLVEMSPGDESQILANSVIDIAADNRGILWLGTHAGLVKYDPKTGTKKRFTSDPSNIRAMQGDDIANVYIDNQQVPWIATDGGGLIAYDEETDQFYSYLNVPGRAGSISSNVVRTVFEDRNGDIWTGNYPGGINFFDRSSTAVETYTHEPGNPQSLSSNSITGVVEDKNGAFWISTDGGGLNFFDPQTDTFTSYKHNPDDPKTPSNNAVLTIMQASDGRLWCGTWGGGAFIFDPQTKEATRLPFDISDPLTGRYDMMALNSQTAWDIREGDDGNMWISTHSGGYALYDQQTKVFKHWTVKLNDLTKLGSNLVWLSFQDSMGDIWLGTARGLNVANLKNDIFKHYISIVGDTTSLSNSSILSLHEDSQSRFWVGTDAGLNLMDRKNGTFKQITKLDGLNDDTIRDIIEDEYGKLWLPTNNGISVYDPNTEDIVNYTRAGGHLLGGFNTNSGLRSSKNEIILGGFEGLRIYKPSQMSTNLVPPRVVLTSLYVMSEKVSPGDDDGILEAALHQTKKVVLDHTQTVFMFEFAALNYRNPEKNKYAYKLEGFDSDWLYVESGRQAKYTNLDAGTYTFRVKASNNDGIWNEEGTSIIIVQLPPPWRTWWAYTIYTFLFFMILVLILRHLNQKRLLVTEQNRILETKVTERTAELRNKNNDIRAMLSNMPQGLFTIQENNTIHHEYSKHLETIFETNNIAEQDAFELLFSRSKIKSDALNTIKAATNAIIGEDKINFSFNVAHLINEYTIAIQGNQKQLELDWNPIIEKEVITKLMVSVRDVTELRSMQKDAINKERQLAIIGQIIHVSPEKFVQFEKSTLQALSSSLEVLVQKSGLNKTTIQNLFRHMHTIKGNARTLGFSFLSDAAHEAESIFSKYRNETLTDSCQNHLNCAVISLKTRLNEYANVFHTVLERGDTGDGDGIWMTHSKIDDLQAKLEKGNLAELERSVHLLRAKRFEDVIEDVFSAVESIAAQLGKPAPKICLGCKEVMIHHHAFDLISSVFAHCMRNSVDHGIETPEERIASGKDRIGRIYIFSKIKDAHLEISVKDDGRGINLEALRQKAKELSLTFEAENPTNTELANTIFTSGVTTKSSASEISGRGIGMDAIQNMLRLQGGDAYIKLLEEEKTQQEFIFFELVLVLPPSTFIELDGPSSKESVKPA